MTKLKKQKKMKSRSTESKTRYPTKDEILELLEVEPDCNEYKTLKMATEQWKKQMEIDKENVWVFKSNTEKTRSLIKLCDIVSCKTGNYLNTYEGIDYSYSKWNFELCLGEKPSIISTLHELVHFLGIESEVSAVHISLFIFKELYPKSFESLRFEGETCIMKK